MRQNALAKEQQVQEQSQLQTQLQEALAKAALSEAHLLELKAEKKRLEERLAEHDCFSRGVLLDGFPRTRTQAEALRLAGVEISAVIHLEVADDVVINRIAGRRIDPLSGKIYHVKDNPPPAEIMGRERDAILDFCRDRVRTIHVGGGAPDALPADVRSRVVFDEVRKAVEGDTYWGSMIRSELIAKAEGDTRRDEDPPIPFLRRHRLRHNRIGRDRLHLGGGHRYLAHWTGHAGLCSASARFSLGNVQSNYYRIYKDLAPKNELCDEFLFTSHIVALAPLFFLKEDIMAAAESAWFSEPLPLVPVPSRLAWLFINNVSQTICLKGVFRTSACVSPLALTIILSVRKFLSVVVSIVIFSNPWTILHSIATVLIFGGAFAYSQAPEARTAPAKADGKAE
eukprot:g22697.t1